MLVKNPVAASLCLALSTFSKIPAPRAEWSAKNMRYMMCFFPLVGVVQALCGALLCLLRTKAGFARADEVFALFLTLLPVFLTGGIHLDGFMDTVDALASRAPRERKLEILKDSRVGAFAVLAAACYVLSYFVLSLVFVSRNSSPGNFSFLRIFCLFLIFAVSRLFSALAVCAFPFAKNSGLARTFSDSSSKICTIVWCSLFLILSFFLLIFFGGRSGIAACVLSLCAFAWYFFMSRREFGGITGDLAGWFVQVCEVLGLFGAAVF